ncbi:Transcription factor tau 55 kDa subunit [Leucoagaricus sp. SymC.cos]|nr:Transcription factor tau 55 kDa subunit [Leucoagaricus sp. SymC.cos]
MSVATKNPFAILDADDASRPSTPAAPAPSNAAPQPPAATRGTQKSRGPASRGGKYYARGGRPGPRDSNQPQAEEPVTENERKSEGGRGRGRGRGGAARGGRRPYDRHSQTGKTDSDKKVHQGWGGDEGNTELKAEEAAENDAAVEAVPEAPADGAEPTAEAQPEGRPRREREPEEEDTTLTLEEYLVQKKEKDALLPQLEATRQANEGADVWKDAVLLSRNEDDEAYFIGKPHTPRKSITGLPRDPPLAAYGEAQAKELASYFLSLPEDERPTAIFSSPYYRCLQTSQPTAQALNTPLYVEHGLSEWYSPIVPGTGLHPRPGSAASLQTFFPEIDPSWISVWYPTQKGEDVSEVHDRTDGFLSVFIPQVEKIFEGKHKRVLLVSHAAPAITLVRSLVVNRELPLRVGCCSLSELVPRTSLENGSVSSTGVNTVVRFWEARKLANGDHLEKGASRDWGFEDIVIEAGKASTFPRVPGSENLPEGPTGAQVVHSLL